METATSGKGAHAPNIVAVPFHGDTILTFEHEDARWVVMRRIVENLGLNWAGQHAKLLDQKSKFSCMDIYTTGLDGKSYEMVAIPTTKLALWLACINPNKVAETVRPKLERYQAESAIALHDYWTKGFASRPVSDGFGSEEFMARLMSSIRGVVHNEVATILPNMVEAKFAAVNGSLDVVGMTAGEVIEMAGFTDRTGLRGLARYVSDRLRRYFARKGVVVRLAKTGLHFVYRFDVITAREWLSDGGRREIEKRIAERHGQGVLKLVVPQPDAKRPNT